MSLAKLMKVIKGNRLPFIPASHEDSQNPGSLKKVLVKKGDVQKGGLQMVNWSLLPAGKSFNSHYHEDLEEIFIIMSGNVELTVDGKTVTLEAGDSVCIPSRSIHTMANKGEKDALFIAIGLSSGQNGKTVVVK